MKRLLSALLVWCLLLSCASAFAIATPRTIPVLEQEDIPATPHGIRNYLRDFTALSDADRRSLMLWDEFAVYALALGDNASAVDEILASRGFDRSMLGL